MRPFLQMSVAKVRRETDFRRERRRSVAKLGSENRQAGDDPGFTAEASVPQPQGGTMKATLSIFLLASICGLAPLAMARDTIVGHSSGSGAGVAGTSAATSQTATAATTATAQAAQAAITARRAQDSLVQATATFHAAQAAQAAARAAALAAASSVPDGLGVGGLNPVGGATASSSGPAIQIIQLSTGSKNQLALGSSGTVTLPSGTPGTDQVSVTGAGTVTSTGGTVTTTAGSVTTTTGGTLAATNGGSIALTAGSGTLTATSATTLTSTVAGTVTLPAGGGTETLPANQAVTVPAGSSIALSGSGTATVKVSGAATVTLAGAGTLALANAAAAGSGGTITTQSGTTSFTNGGSVSSLAAGAQINVVGSGTVQLTGTTDGSAPVTLPLILPATSNFTTTGTLLSTQGYNLPSGWTGVGALSQSSGDGLKTVTVTQTAAEALLYWTTFNIGKNTLLDFDQSAGGASVGTWVAINQIQDPSLAPSQILGQLQAPGQVYVINQNGIIFGGSSQVNTHALTASSLPINSNLVTPEVLLGGSTTADQFLFTPSNLVTVASSSTNSTSVKLTSSTLPAGFGVGSLLLGTTVKSVGGSSVVLSAKANATLTNTVVAFSNSTSSGGGFSVTVASSSTSSPTVTLASATLPSGLTVGSQLLGATVQSIDGATVTLTANANAKVTNKAVAFSSGGGESSVVVQAGAQLTSPTTADHVGGKIALIGPVVDNEGTISTPDGQAILAAGLQVGFSAHAQTDPSLRGVDVFVGQVNAGNNADGVAFGTATNGGVIESPRADVTMTGMNVNQDGVIDSLTSVTLNGRIDLLADYGAITHTFTLANSSQTETVLIPTQTGTVTLGANSVSQILPDTTGATEVGTALALPSLVNIEAQTIHLATGAELLAPGATASLPDTATGSIGGVDLTGAALTSGVNLSAGTWNSVTFSLAQGQVNIDSGAVIDVSGSQDVTASVAENIVQAQLRGTELANSPLQQNGPLRGQTVNINIADSGVYNGVAWIGSPIGDLSGYAGLVQHTVNELTVNGGTVGIQAGSGVAIAAGATINVSGGSIDYQGANVPTTKVLTTTGQILDISQATPDQIYQGLYTPFTTTSSKWGVTQTFNNSLEPATVYSSGYIQGGNGGALTISSPALTMQGNLYGNTVAGVNQVTPTKQVQISELSGSGASSPETVTGLAQFANASFSASSSTPSNNFMTQILLPIDAVPTPGTLVLNLFPQQLASGATATIKAPDVVFQPSSGPIAVNPFAGSGNPELDLSADLVGIDGFGNLTIAGNTPLSTNYNATSPGLTVSTEGNIAVASGAALTTLPGGAITLAGVNLDIEGSIFAPGGSLNFLTQNVVSSQTTNITSPLAPVAGRGNFTLGANASLSAAGLVVNNTAGAPGANTLPQVVNGGSVTIKSLNADLATGSNIDVSGGVVVGATGKASYGTGGSIDLEAGRDPYNDATTNYGIVGGQLVLGANLSAFSGKSGGTLTLIAPTIQVGGTTLANGEASGSPIVQESSLIWGDGTTVWLDRTGTADFFSQGGFSAFSLTGLGLAPITYDNTGVATSENPYASTPGVVIAPGTALAPVAQSYQFVTSAGGVDLTPVTYALASQRSPVSLSFTASGVTASALPAPNNLVVFGDLVLGAGATIQTDPLGSVSLGGQRSVAILGQVYAPGGKITVSGASDSINLFQSNLSGSNSASDIVATVDLGPESVLSTKGAVETTVNAFGYDTGNVLNGGSITVSGNVVGEAGSVLDVSGTSATLDVLPGAASITSTAPNSQRMVPLNQQSNGGSITLTGGEELFVDSTLLGAAGGTRAQGGSLTITNGFSNYSVTNPDTITVQNPLGLDATLVVTGSGPTRAASPLTGLAVIGQEVTPSNPTNDVDGNAILGYFAANSNLFVSANPDPAIINNGGIAGGLDSLTLNGTVQFSGPVSIATTGSLVVGTNAKVTATSLTFSGGVLTDGLLSGGVIYGDSPVTLSSAYVRLGLPFTGPIGTAIIAQPSSGPGVLTVHASELIDVGNLRLANFNQLNLNSSGDVRGDGALNVTGNIAIDAAQIYPTTDSNFTIAAYNPTSGSSSVTLTDTAGSLPALPLSAGGILDIYAQTITQGGVLRAPIGTINLGSLAPPTGFNLPVSNQVTLSAGSITSVSAVDPDTGLGMTIPYGSVDAGGNWIDPAGNTITAASTPGLPAKAITISATNVDDISGSVLDVRGGGNLIAAQFVSGTGGTNDILSSTTSFAILPQTAPGAAYAPFDIVSGYATSSYGNNLKVGDVVYLTSGAGVTAGYYALLPARYALLPGAFLVTPKSGAPSGSAVTQLDGSVLVSGFRASSLNSTFEQTVVTLFEVDSSAVISERADYVNSLANTYFPQSASALSAATPRLPVDAGQVALNATQSLTLPNASGTLLGQAAEGGLGSIIDIASPTPINIYNSDNPATPAVAGDLNLDATALNSFGADSLLIGGSRTVTSTGTQVSISTNSLTVNNAGSPLMGPDIILVSGGLLAVDPGSVIEASTTSTSTQSLAIGNGGNSVNIASSSSSSPTVTLTSSTLPANFAVGSGLLGSTVASINGNTVTLAGNANTTVSNAAELFTILVNVASSSTNSPIVTLASSTLPSGFGVGSGLLGGTVKSISGTTVTLSGVANATVATNTPEAAFNSDGTLLRVNGAANAVSTRPYTINLADPAPQMVIGKDVVIEGGSLTLDSTGSSSLDPSATLKASGTVSIGSKQISLVLDNSQPSGGLVISGDALSTLQSSAQTLSLLTYSSLDIYGSGNIGNSPDASGHYQVQNLVLHAAEIRGFNTGGNSVNINAQNVTLDNSASGTGLGPASAAAGTLAINSGTITLGNNPLAIDQYAQVTLSATNAIILGNGTGSLATEGDLTLSTPLLTVAPIVPLTPLQERNGATPSTATTQTISAGGSLTLASPGGAIPTLSEGLGATITLAGTSVMANSTIQLPSGSLSIVATTGDLSVGGTLDVSGTQQNIYSLTEYTSGGQINLTSYTGNISLNTGSTVNVSAQSGGGNAGSLSLSAPSGNFAFDGSTLLGQGGVGGQGGTFSLDAARLAGTSLAPLEEALNPVVSGAIASDTYLGGFTQAQTIRLRTGDATVDGKSATDAFNLSTDAGSITVSGEIVGNSGQTNSSGTSTASIDVTTAANSNGVNVLSNPGVTGGSIDLEAGGSVTLLSGSQLSVAAQTVSDAGQGGSVTLEAGATTNSVEPSTSQSRDATTNRFASAPVVDIQTGSVIDLSVAATSKMFDGSTITGTTGTLHLRAPQTQNNTDVQIDPINGTIVNPSSIVVEGYQIFTATDGSIDNQETAVMNNGNTFVGMAGQPASTTYTTMLNALLPSNGANSALLPLTLIEPGAEIVDPNLDTTANPTAGDLTLASNWDLSTFRFGPNSAAGDLTLRAGGNLVFDFGASLSDGFTTNPTFSNLGLWSDVLMPVGSLSWSYRLVAGADLSAADYQQVLPAIPTSSLVAANPMSLSANSGSVVIGLGAPELPRSTSANTSAIMSSYSGGAGFYQTIRTGTGNIDLVAGHDVQLLNNVATIYTAGTQAATVSGFDVPNLTDPTTDSANSNYNFPGIGGTIATAQYSQAGGNVTIAAQGNIAHYTAYDSSSGLPIVGYDLNGNPLMDDSSLELPTNWLYRRGYSVGNGFGTNADGQVASTTWWIDFSNFFEGVGALGGGNVTLNAGGSINNVDAVVPTNAMMPGYDANNNLLAPSAASLVELGGGDLIVRAGSNINGGAYYVERGQGTLAAGDQILTNATRNVVTSGPVMPLNYLPTTLFLGKGDFSVSTGGNLLLGPVVNPFLLPQGINNTVNDKSYFSTYAATDSVALSSLTGSVTIEDSSATGTSNSLLLNFYNDQLSENPASTSFSFYYPWLGLVETQPSAFSNQFSLMPPTVQAIAFSGDLNLEGDLTLSPSPTGTVSLVADGSINAFQPVSVSSLGIVSWAASQINLSDANPDSIPGITTALSYAPNSAQKISLAKTDSALFTGFNNLFNISGSTTGIFSLLSTQQELHADLPINPSDPNSPLGPLHASDSTPVYLYAASGNIDGVNLFSGKLANVVAGNDITNVSLYVQNDNATDITLVEAGRDIIAYDQTSILRQETHLTGGLYLNENDAADIPLGLGAGAPNAGDIQIAGPGTLEVLAGRNLTLGDQAPNADGTGAGILSIGNTLDPYLSTFNGANIIAGAGIGMSTSQGVNNLSFSTFIDAFLNPNPTSAQVDPSGTEAARYLPELGSLLGVTDVTNAQIWNIFSGTADTSLTSAQKSIQAQLTPGGRDTLALTIFYDVLNDAGIDHNNASSPNKNTYNEGYAAIAALFPSTYINSFLNPNSPLVSEDKTGTVAALYSGRYLPELGSLLGVTDVTNAQIWNIFSGTPDTSLTTAEQKIQAQLTPANRDELALTVFSDFLSDYGHDQNDAVPPFLAFAKLAALFPSTDQGDISLTAREIKTTNGGNISLLAPGGGIDVGINNTGAQAIDQGILTVDGGNISIFTNNNVAVGTSRIFTLHGGNEILWSTVSNIAAGASSKTVQSAPPTRVLIDTQSGNVETDLAGLATGGGIGVLETVVGAPPGNVNLIAPSGTVDAGDAGIRSSGNINIAAALVQNAGNISAGGSSSGVSTVSAPNISASVAGSAASGAAAGAANETQRQQQAQTQAPPEDLPSIISVQVIGYGGGDDDSASISPAASDATVASTGAE